MIRGYVRTQQLLDTQKVVTNNHDAVSQFTVARHTAEPLQAPRAVLPHPVPPRLVPAAPHFRTPAVPFRRDLSPLPPFGLPALLPQLPQDMQF